MARDLTITLVRRRGPEDDEFILRLGGQVFGIYSRSPARAVRHMVHERRAWTEIAFVDGRRAGFFVLGFAALARPFGPIRRPLVAHLNAIAVAAEQRGLGVGRRLLQRAEAVAGKRGAQALTLMTAVSNTPARRLFESAGFQVMAQSHYAYRGGQPAVLMTKPLW